MIDLLGAIQTEYLHIYHAAGEGVSVDPLRSIGLFEPDEDPRWKKLCGLAWQYRLEINPLRLMFSGVARKLNTFAPDVFWISVSSDSEARIALSLARYIRVPILLYVMDLRHDPLEPAVQKDLCKLIRRSRVSLAVTPAIARQMEKAGGPSTRVLYNVGHATSARASAYAGGKFRLLINGRIYSASLEILADAVLQHPELFSQVEIVYAGPGAKGIPERLKGHVKDLGFFADRDAYEAMLRECHACFLQISTELDIWSRYSFPSRLTQVLQAGIPVVAPTVVGSSLEEIFSSLSGTALHFIKSPQELAERVHRLMNDSITWRRGHDAGIRFWQENLDVAIVSRRLLQLLNEAAGKS